MKNQSLDNLNKLINHLLLLKDYEGFKKVYGDCILSFETEADRYDVNLKIIKSKLALFIKSGVLNISSFLPTNAYDFLKEYHAFQEDNIQNNIFSLNEKTFKLDLALKCESDLYYTKNESIKPIFFYEEQENYESYEDDYSYIYMPLDMRHYKRFKYKLHLSSYVDYIVKALDVKPKISSLTIEKTYKSNNKRVLKTIKFDSSLIILHDLDEVIRIPTNKALKKLDSRLDLYFKTKYIDIKLAQ